MNRRRPYAASPPGTVAPAEAGSAIKLRLVQDRDGEVWLRLELLDHGAVRIVAGDPGTPIEDADLADYAAGPALVPRRQRRHEPRVGRRRWWLAAIPVAAAAVLAYGALGAGSGARHAQATGPDVSVVSSRPVRFSLFPADLGCSTAQRGCTTGASEAAGRAQAASAACPALTIPSERSG